MEMWDIYEKDNTVFFYRIGRGQVVFTVTFENTQGFWTVQQAQVVDWFIRRNSAAVAVENLDNLIRGVVAVGFNRWN